MKSDYLDYLWSSLALSLAVVVTFSVVAGVVSPLFQSYLGGYAFVFEILVGVFVFGMCCALLAKLVRLCHPLRPGDHSMDSGMFTAWKLYTVLYEFGIGALKPFTLMFFRPLVQSLFGARIGKDVALGGKLVDPHLVEIDDGVIVGEGSVVTAHAIVSGRIVLGRVKLEPGATIGVGAVIYPGVTVGRNAIVGANSVVLMNTIIPPGEFWGGAPARRIKSL